MRSILALFALLLTLPLAWGEGRKIAVVVGVHQYKHGELTNLEYASRDAIELADQLQKSGYDPVILLHSDQADPQLVPNFQNVSREIAAALSDVAKEDIVLFALSGHGIENDKGENFFCPFDANPLKVERCLSIQQLIEDMHTSGAGVKLLLVDACRDAAKLPRGSKGASGDTVTALPQGMAAIFSCASGQRSWESKEAGGGHGIFFHTVLEALRGQAAGPKGDVTWDRLVVHVKENVPTLVTDWVGPRILQEPHEVKNLVASPVLARVPVTRPSSPPTEEMRRPSSEPTSNRSSKSITSQTTSAKLLLIPAGEFMMGSEESDNEKPVHRVKISQPFYLGETEVTQGQWKRVMGTEPWKGRKYVQEGDDYPATYVSWEDAVEYCKRLSQQDGREYRLPTEAEWEYACRSGTRTKWHFGDLEHEMDEYAWTTRNTWGFDEPYAHLVRQKKSNPWGLFDMYGNVCEWCSDRYGGNYYGESPRADPPGPSDGTDRVYRGGSHTSPPVITRTSIRLGSSPDFRGSFLGFRLASSSRE